ncbi:hypothetical protein GQ457_16G019950 [Hibiscus cannabinus]
MRKEVELDTHEERAGDGGTEGFSTSLDDKRGRVRGVIRAVRDLEGGSLTLWRQEGKEDQGITFVQLGFLHIWSRVSVLFSGIGTRIQHWNPHIGTARRVSVPLLKLCRYRYSGTSISTPLEISLVSIHGKEYRYPSSLMELEYRYWLSSTGTGCLRTVFGVP